MSNIIKALDSSSRKGGTVVVQRPEPEVFAPTIPKMVDVWDSAIYAPSDVDPKHKISMKYYEENRGISSQSPYVNFFGIPRVGFDMARIEQIRVNPYYILPETATCNYLRGVSFDVVDALGQHVDSAYNFLMHPNPEQDFWTVIIAMVRDLIAYDAGVLVKTFTKGGYLAYLHSYSAVEFRANLDVRRIPEYPTRGLPGSTTISNGYITEWWQISSIGYYRRFIPEEVVYFMQYPQSKSIYGTAIMQNYYWHFKYLMDSTAAIGKVMVNGLVTNMVFTHPDIGNIDTLRKRLDSTKQVNTGPGNFGKVLHLLGNEDVKTVSSNLVDMEWLNSQKYVFTIILQAFGFPASEFSMMDNRSRTGDYVSRNIMRSRMLTVLLTLIESKINNEVLPYLKGYNKGWKFSFQRSIDLDDQIKESHITQQRAASFGTLVSYGVPIDLAMKLAGFGKELTADERDMLNDLVEGVSRQNGGGVLSGRSDRYDAPGYQETFMGYEEVNAVKENINNEKRYDMGLGN